MMENTTSTPGRWLSGSLQAYWAHFWHLIQSHVVRRLRSYGLTVALDVLVVAAAYESAAIVRFIDNMSVAIAQIQALFFPCLLAGVLYAIVAYLLGLHRRLWHFASLRDGFALIQTVGISTVLIGMFDLVGLSPGRIGLGGPQERVLPLSVIIGGACLSFLFLGGEKVLPKIALAHQAAIPARNPSNTTRVLIVGAGQAGASIAARLIINSGQGYQVVGFVDDNPAKWRNRIRGLPILGPAQDIPALTDRWSIDLIAIALPSVDPTRVSEIIAICQQTSARIEILPGLAEMVRHQPHHLELRQVNVANLLGREVVPLHTPETQDFLRGKTILVTGAAGSIGSEICQQMVAHEHTEVIAVDNNETGLFDLAASLRKPDERRRLRLHIGDITDFDSMARLFASSRPHVVFHAAAYKHVPLLEQHPQQAIRTNVLGTYHLCRLAHEYNVGAFVFISSDKAADPVSVLGASKRIGEIMVQAMAQAGDNATHFCAVRFGNVIGSRGSVVPLFEQQIGHGGPITVTHPEATRYFMTIPEACGLVILSASMASNGDLFLLDMGNPVRIADLAAKMIRMHGLRVGSDVHIEYVGLRSGERLHEVLAGPDEQLLPTAHHKIFRVLPQMAIPPLTSIEQWMQALDDGSGHEDMPAVREQLFELVSEYTSVKANT